jgi:hypothetical protein
LLLLEFLPLESALLLLTLHLQCLPLRRERTKRVGGLFAHADEGVDQGGRVGGLWPDRRRIGQQPERAGQKALGYSVTRDRSPCPSAVRIRQFLYKRLNRHIRRNTC